MNAEAQRPGMGNLAMPQNAKAMLFSKLARSNPDAGKNLVGPDTFLKWAVLSIVGAVPLLILMMLVLVDFEADSPWIQGCRKLGLGAKEKSFLEDETEEKTVKLKFGSVAKVKSLFVYPIKSCMGVELAEAEVVPTGLKYDRQFCLAQLNSPFPVSVDASKEDASAHKWNFMTQRQLPMMSQIKVEVFIPNPTTRKFSPGLDVVKNNGTLRVSFPYQEDGILGWMKYIRAFLRGEKPMHTFYVPYDPPKAVCEKEFKAEKVKIWNEVVEAWNMEKYCPDELRYFLGTANPITLFRINDYREVFRTAPRKEALGYQAITAFADAFPIHVLGVESVRDLSKTQPEGSAVLSARRFRPNILTEGAQAYAEDDWLEVKIGGHQYHVACRCVRCKLPNVDPNTGIRDRNQPDTTLRKTRTIEKASPTNGCLGVNAVPADEVGTVRVGDEVVLLKSGFNAYEPQGD